MAIARTMDRLRFRARAMVSSRARTRAWDRVCLRLSARTVFAGGPNLT